MLNKILIIILFANYLLSQTICIDYSSNQIIGQKDSYRYELWNQNSAGEACITLLDGALFKGYWKDVDNYLARRGLGFDQTKQHQGIGQFLSKYDCKYEPKFGFGGNSYLSVYGWSISPLVEFYIIEDWRNWIPSMANGSEFMGEFTANGSIYEIYTNIRYNKPSILGTSTFLQFFSIRRERRNSGTINISEHFNKWEEYGMYLGNLHEVSFVVEGYQNSGNFEFEELDIYIKKNTSIDKNLENILIIYPNPSNGKLNILTGEDSNIENIKVFNSCGEIINLVNKKNNTISFNELSSGIYFITYTLNNKIESKSFIVQ